MIRFTLMVSIVLVALMTPSRAIAQVYNMANGSATVSSGSFYDSGGAGGNYGNNEDLTFTLCPSIPGTAVSLDFSRIYIQASDSLLVYDGTTTTTLKTHRTSVNSSAHFTITSSDPSGCLTFNFKSNGGTNRLGWSF